MLASICSRYAQARKSGPRLRPAGTLGPSETNYLLNLSRRHAGLCHECSPKPHAHADTAKTVYGSRVGALNRVFALVLAKIYLRTSEVTALDKGCASPCFDRFRSLTRKKGGCLAPARL